MFNNFCIRHSEQQITHFCSNQICQSFLTFFCTKCDIAACNKHYHLQPIDNLENVVNNKIFLPQYDSKQIDYCKSQMNKIIANFASLQAKVIQDYDEAINQMIQYIQERSDQFKNEIVHQIQLQKSFMEDKLTTFKLTMDQYYQDYKQSYDKSKAALTVNVNTDIHIEAYYKQIDINELKEHYNTLLRMQPEIDILITENSLQITKEQQLLESLNENIYKDLEEKMQENSENSLTLLWSKYYQMTYNVHLFDSQNSSLVQSEIVENIRISRSSSQSHSVFSEIDHIIALGQQQKGSYMTSLKLKSQTYGYSKFNLTTLGQLTINQNHIDISQNLPTITPYCILALKNQNVILTAGDSNEVFVWIKKKEQQSWKLESSLQLPNQSFIQCMELVYNPFLSESRNSRQSIANLKILLNPIIVVCGGNNVYLVQFDMLTNKLTQQCKYTIKDQKENEIHSILQCQVMGSYNYFVIGMEKGSLILFSYIISIDNTFTIRIEQIVKHHKDCITSMELIGDQIFGVASNDRSVSLWNYYNNKLKLLPLKLNRFWEDIPCIRQVYPNCFITFDTSFNVIQWFLEDCAKVSIINSIQQNKQKIEIYEAVVIHNPDNREDFCLLILAKELNNYKILILDRYFQVVQTEKLPQSFCSILTNSKKKIPQSLTNYKIGLVNDQLLNKSFSSFADLKQSETIKPNQNEKQQSFTQQQQLNLSKKIIIGIVNNTKTNQHFIELSYIIGNE